MKKMNCLFYLLFTFIQFVNGQNVALRSLPESFMRNVTKEFYFNLNKENLGEKNRSEVWIFKVKIFGDSLYSIIPLEYCPNYVSNSMIKAIKVTLKKFSEELRSELEFNIPLIILYKPNKNELLNENFTVEQIQLLFNGNNNHSELEFTSQPIIYVNPYRNNWKKFEKYFDKN